MRIQFMLIRVITAAILFMILAQANVWADTQTHLVVAVGYRAFLVAAPLFMYFGVANGMRFSIGIGVISLALAMVSFNYIAVGLFALSMAVSGYISKYVNSSTSRGAADNKVSLNVGSVIAGLLVSFSSDKFLLLGASLVILGGTLVLSMKMDWNKVLENENAVEKLSATAKKVSAVPLMGWMLIGIATGIKLTGIFAILPQYLIHKVGSLPSWYGTMIVLNSLGVIFFQHKVLGFLDRSRTRMTFIFAFSAMALLALPSLMSVEFLPMAVVWLVLLTLGECALSRYDKLAKDDGYLFYKEIMVGAGSFITVALSRNFPESIYLSGVVGCLALVLGIVLIKFKVSKALTKEQVAV